MSNLKTYVMRTKLLFAFLLLGIFGCINKIEKEEPWISIHYYDPVPVSIVAKEELPEWLGIIVDQWESAFFIYVFKGEWQESTIYNVKYTLSRDSHRFDDVYYENGEHIAFVENSIYAGFRSTSKNWELIFQIEDGVVRTE